MNNGRWKEIYHRLIDNPVATKELRRFHRQWKSSFIFVIYGIVMTLFIIGVYALLTEDTASYGSVPNNLIGKTLLATTLLMQMIVAIFWAPAFTMNGINREKIQQNYAILRTTTLSASDLVLGKLIPGVGYSFLLLIITLPMLSITYLIGGVTIFELLISQIALFTAAVYYSLIGLYYSARFRSPTNTFIFTYLRINANLFLLPIVLFGVGSGIVYGIEQYVRNGGVVPFMSFSILLFFALLIAYFISSSNLPLALFVSELLLFEYGVRFGIEITALTYHFWVVSPWVLVIFFQLLFSWHWFRKTVRLIEQIPVS